MDHMLKVLIIYIEQQPANWSCNRAVEKIYSYTSHGLLGGRPKAGRFQHRSRIEGSGLEINKPGNTNPLQARTLQDVKNRFPVRIRKHLFCCNRWRWHVHPPNVSDWESSILSEKFLLKRSFRFPECGLVAQPTNENRKQVGNACLRFRHARTCCYLGSTFRKLCISTTSTRRRP